MTCPAPAGPAIRSIGRILLAGFMIFALTGCYIASHKPLFGPKSLVRAPLVHLVYKGDEDSFEIRQFGTKSMTFLVAHHRTDAAMPDMMLYRIGLVPLDGTLYLAQVAPLMMDGPAASQRLDYDGALLEEPETDPAEGPDASYAYAFLEVETGSVDNGWTTMTGITGFRLYATFDAGMADDLNALAERHGVPVPVYEMADGGGRSADELKAFLIDLFQTHRDAFTEPGVYRGVMGP